jgi:F-type H+-transporting ATPase subunit epsilon
MAAAGKTIQLEIMTPLKNLYSGEIESLIGTATDGLFGVLVDHAPMLAALGFGLFTIRESAGKERVFITSDGFFEINHNKAAVLVDTAEDAKDIDVARARAARERAEKRIQKKESVDMARAEAALRRALTRLKAAGAK